MATGTKPYVQPGKPKKKKGLSSGQLIAIVVVAVVVLFGVIAVAANLGGKSSSSSSSGGSSGEVKETNKVTWTGEQLPPQPDAPSTPDPAVGKVPPTLQGFSFDGTPVKIDPADGKAKMLVFVAHWCPHCRREIPRIVKWNASGQKPADLEVYAIATGTDPTLPNYPPSAWLKAESWPFPVMADGPGPRPNFDAATAYGLTSYPYVVVVGADGKVKARHSGEFGADDPSAIAAMEQFVRQALGTA